MPSNYFNRKMIALGAQAAHDALNNDTALLATGDGLNDMCGGAWVVPVLIPEGVETGDGRSFDPDSLSIRDLPLSLLWQVETGDGHDGAVVVGRIDSVEILPEGGLGNARGVFDTGPYGVEAERLVRGGFLRGISADLDKFEGAVEDDEEEPSEVADKLEKIMNAADDSEADDVEVEEEPKKSKQQIKSDRITVSSARLTAATLVPKPAFQESYIMMADEFDLQGEVMIADGPYEEVTNDIDVQMAALAASAAPVMPPKAWFDDPKLTGPTPLTVSDDGRVFGHIAAWHVQHIGLPNATRPPRSASGYSYFQTGALRTAEGTDVSVGQLTLSGGHAALRADASEAVKHYDDTASAIADVRAGEDAHGIYVSGALRPGVTPEQVRVLRASAPSGDWRPIEGRLELVAVCQVNVPGFPVARAMVASGHVTALVAAGARFMAELRDEPMRDLDYRLKQVEATNLSILDRERSEAASRVSALAAMRSDALVASAAAARDRLKPLAERRESLVASAAAARATVASLRVIPEFEEVEHPRHDDGKFRRVLGRLDDLLTGVDGAAEATSAVAQAADHEDTGAAEAADSAAKTARARLTDLEQSVTDPATLARLREAEGILDSAIGGVVDSFNESNAVQTDALVSYLLNALVQQIDPTKAIRDAPKNLRQAFDGREMQSTQDIADYVKKLISDTVSPV